MKTVVANKDANQEFKIPISWQVCDFLRVIANSLEEAYNFVNEDHQDECPLGDDPQYVEGSYEVGHSLEGCEAYIKPEDVTCIRFNCENLTQFTDSMLFDSETEVANAEFSYKGEHVTIYLDVRGEVRVTYKDETYSKPSEFPEELKTLIKENPNLWTTDDDVYVDMNNRFEYLDGVDGYVCESDVSKMTPEKLIDEMRNIAAHYFGIGKERK